MLAMILEVSHVPGPMFAPRGAPGPTRAALIILFLEGDASEAAILHPLSQYFLKNRWSGRDRRIATELRPDKLSSGSISGSVSSCVSDQKRTSLIQSVISRSPQSAEEA